MAGRADLRRIGRGAVIPVAALVAWCVLTPSPGAIIASAAELVQRDDLAGSALLSVGRAMRGYVVGALAGTVLGGIAAHSSIARDVLAPALRALRAVPSVAWFPVLLVVLGVGDTATVTVIAIAVALPVWAAASASGGEAAPLFAGLRQGLAQSWVILVAAELVTAPAGIGQLLAGSGGAGRADRMLVAVAVIGLLAFVSDLLLGVAERLVRRVTADAGTVIQNTDHL
jgi:sulfonate transport system permease protein